MDNRKSFNTKDRKYNGIKIQEYKEYRNTRQIVAFLVYDLFIFLYCFLLFWFFFSSFCALCPNVARVCIVFCCFLFVLVLFLFVLCLMPQCCPCLCIVHCWSFIRVSLSITISNNDLFNHFLGQIFVAFWLEY